MHIYFSGIGGVGLGPLANIALDAGCMVSGSDALENTITKQLAARGATIFLQQSGGELADLHKKKPVDWLVQTSALPENHPELLFATSAGIKITKRDGLLQYIIQQKNLKLLAVAGTHGKTTTTAMLIWLFQQLHIPISYSVGAELNFGPMGKYDKTSDYFIYECDEFDRNFLQFQPFIAAITNIDYDHPDTYKTENDYVQAFSQFAGQSQQVIAAQSTQKKLGLQPTNVYQKSLESSIQLPGLHNRQNAGLALSVMKKLSAASDQQLIDCVQKFPGTSRRFEKLADTIYSDYAHHPVEIAATLQLASELTNNIVVVYQPHQNIRQHLIKNDYKNCFKKAKKIYWLPTFLSREDESIAVFSPQQLSSGVDPKKIVFSHLDQNLWRAICQQSARNTVVIMGAGSIDNWVRQQLQAETSV